MKRWPVHSCLWHIWSEFNTRTVISSYQKWHNNENPIIRDIKYVPKIFGNLFGSLIRLCLHLYEDVSENARIITEKGFVRFPCLADIYYPIFLMAITRQPLPNDLSPHVLTSSSPHNVNNNNNNYKSQSHQSLLNMMSQLDFDKIKLNSNLTTLSQKDDNELSIESEQDAIVMDTLSLMTTTNLTWKGIFHDPEKLVLLIYGLMGTRINTDFQILEDIRTFLKKFMVRYYYPYYLRMNQTSSSFSSRDLIDLHVKLCYLGKEGILSNWKYTVLANVFILITLPHDMTFENSVTLIDHFISMIKSKSPLLRKLGIIGIYTSIQHYQHSNEFSDKDEIKKNEFIKHIENHISSNGLLVKLIDTMINNQDANLNDADGGSSSSSSGDGIRKSSDFLKYIMKTNSNSIEEKLITNGYSFFIDRLSSWLPQHLSSMNIINIKIIQMITQISPELVLNQIKDKLINEIKISKEQNNTKVISEILSGLSSCTYIYHQKDWDDWIQQGWKDIVDYTSLDHIEKSISNIIKYSVDALMKDEAWDGLLKLFDMCFQNAEIIKNGNKNYEEVKRINILHNAFIKLCSNSPIDKLPKSLLSLLKRLINEFEIYMKSDFLNIREHASGFFVYICSYILSSSNNIENHDIHDVIIMSSNIDDGHQLIIELKVKVKSLLEEMKERFYEGVMLIQREYDSKENTISPEINSKIGFVAQYVIATVISPNFIHVKFIKELAIQMISGILKIKEIGLPSLKSLQDETFKAFLVIMLLKTKDTSQIKYIIQILNESRNWTQWHARQAALIYTQVI